MCASLILPEITCKQDYVKVYADTSVWLPAARTICARHGLDAGDLRRETLGSNVVFRAGARILKLFCRLWRDDFVSERSSLAHVRGLPIPELVADGELEDWPYLVMTVVPGMPAVDVWGSLEKEEKAGIILELGQIIRRLHEHPPLSELAMDWNTFLGDRIARADEHHGVDERWLNWVRDRITGFCEPPFKPVLLNADLTDDHILLSERGGTWRITGLIDFGDAKMGHPYYDFIAPLACFTFGQPNLSQILVESYGLQLNADVVGRLTTYCLLHKFCRLKDFLIIHPVPDGSAFHRALWNDL